MSESVRSSRKMAVYLAGPMGSWRSIWDGLLIDVMDQNENMLYADVVVVWVPPEAGPVTYMELGFICRWPSILVGVAQEHQRREDILMHLERWRPGLEISGSLIDLYRRFTSVLLQNQR